TQASVNDPDFQISGITLPYTLNPGQRVVFNVVFAPQVTGASNGSLNLVHRSSLSPGNQGDSGTNNWTNDIPIQIPMSGTGDAGGQLTTTPATLDFGSVTVNKSQTLSETLTNTGGTSVTLSSDTVNGTGYSVSGLALPMTLSAGASTTFNVTFAPKTAGSVSG